MSGGAAGVVRSGDNVNPCADFADTVVLEVREETGVVAELGAVLGMRHGHGKRRQKMRPSRLTRAAGRELLDATWMTPEQMQAVVAAPDEPLEGRGSQNN